MRIDLSTVNRDDFIIKPGPHGLLINPAFTKHRWKDEELIYRSLLVSEAGEVLSAGFPKFLNKGENPNHDAVLATMLQVAPSRVFVTNKLDGSLVIRSVIDGKVIFRTRGSQTLNQFHDEVMAVANQYPYLLDPEIGPHLSLLMEYTGHQSVEDQVVIRYDKSELHILGAVGHAELSVHNDPQSLMILSQCFDVPHVEVIESGDLAAIEALENTEGVVVSWHDITTCRGMLKVKTAWYMLRHRLKYNLSEKDLKTYCYLNQLTSLEDVQSDLYSKYGIDYEAVASFTPCLQRFFGEVALMKYEYVFLAASLFTDLEALNNRKDKVGRIQTFVAERKLPKYYFHAFIADLDGKPQWTNDIMLSNILDQPVAHIRELRKVGMDLKPMVPHEATAAASH